MVIKKSHPKGWDERMCRDMKNKHETSNFELQQEIKQLKQEIEEFHEEKPWTKKDNRIVAVSMSIITLGIIYQFNNINYN